MPKNCGMPKTGSMERAYSPPPIANAPAMMPAIAA